MLPEFGACLAEFLNVRVVDRRVCLVYHRVRNTDHHKANPVAEDSGGIGLENLKRRLALLYPGEQALILGKDGGWFEAELVLT